MRLEVTNSPFTEKQAELMNQLLPTLTETQIYWLNGYLAFYRGSGAGAAQAESLTEGVSQQAAAVALEPVAVSVVQHQLPTEATVLFGSQTGNSQRLAGKLADKLKELGIAVTLSAMNAYKTNGLKKATHLFIVASTHGEGDPPDNAITFHEFLYSKRAPKLSELQYAVLSLGDSSYEFFCKTGQDFDQRLEELGAKRLTDRVDCDLDFEEPAAGWMANVVKALQGDGAGVQQQSDGVGVKEATPIGASSFAGQETIYSRTHPFQAEVLTNLNLNGRGSDRETRHLELTLEGSGLTYEPGDCVGIYPQNSPELVRAILDKMKWDGNDPVIVGKAGEEVSLHEALLKHVEITVLSKPLLEKAQAYSECGDMAVLLQEENKNELRSYVKGRDVLDLLTDFAPWRLTAAEFVALLRKLPPRLYSIASSNRANPEEVHVTIRKVQYDSHGRKRDGVCSVHVSERLEEGEALPIFIQHNPGFKLPANPDTPIIMVGPGTGVAPFRAFLEEREELGAEGKSWLFYGDRRFVTDFLYQTDWQRMLKDGVLTKLEVAFSRDSEEKVYVQHRMLEHAAELYGWLQEGAHIYVCGDEKHMAHDVHDALLTIVQEQGGRSREEAAEYVNELIAHNRYQRDVY